AFRADSEARSRGAASSRTRGGGGAGVSRPLVGLTIGPENATSVYLRLRATYPAAVASAGGLPVLVPPMPAEALRETLQRLGARVLAGGLDVDPAEYGEPPHPETQINQGLDALEMRVAQWAVSSNVPTLGICRGQQLLNVALGGSLVQHMEGHRQTGAR